MLEKGQSLFEVVVATALIALVSVAVVGLATMSVRNSGYSKNQTLANKYAQEAVEWLREERDEDWNRFEKEAQAKDDTEVRRCINSFPDSGDPDKNISDADAGPCTGNITGTIIKREFSLKEAVDINENVIPNTVRANVYTLWSDNISDHQVKIVTDFSDWSAAE